MKRLMTEVEQKVYNRFFEDGESGGSPIGQTSANMASLTPENLISVVDVNKNKKTFKDTSKYPGTTYQEDEDFGANLANSLSPIIKKVMYGQELYDPSAIEAKLKSDYGVSGDSVSALIQNEVNAFNNATLQDGETAQVQNVATADVPESQQQQTVLGTG